MRIFATTWIFHIISNIAWIYRRNTSKRYNKCCGLHHQIKY